MLYEIKGEYYIRRGRKYTKVNVEGTGDNIKLTPDMKKVLENDGSFKVKEISFEELKKIRKPSSSDNYER